MKNTYLLVLLIGSIIIFSCTKENEELRLSDFNVPSINGYYLRDFYGDNIGLVGIPNVKLGDGTDHQNSKYYFSFYPNPCTEDMCAIYTKSPAGTEIKKLWITQANWNTLGSNELIDINNTNNMIVGGSPIFQTEFTSDNLRVNLSSFPNGYYRIYLKVNDYLLYDNLVIYKPIRH